MYVPEFASRPRIVKHAHVEPHVPSVTMNSFVLEAVSSQDGVLVFSRESYTDAGDSSYARSKEYLPEKRSPYLS